MSELRQWALPRVLGHLHGQTPGPAFIITGGIHGNEPAGALAAQSVLAEIQARGLAVRGEVLALTGNRKALAQGVRYLAGDLNRRWTAARVAQVLAQAPSEDDPEDAEQRALLTQIHDAEVRCPAGVILLDLHTTSSDGPPFSVMSDTLRNRRLAFALPVTTILGLEESVDGTSLEYLTELGHIALAVETGQHFDPQSQALHASVIWLSLIAMGVLDEAAVPEAVAHRAALRAASLDAPPVVELVCRKGVSPEDAFVMRPGYRGFQAVKKGEHLADVREGPVCAPSSGLILMPLYQPQGSDGYFIVRRVARWWLHLALLLRRLKLHTMLPALPGVARHPTRTHCLRVNPKVARWLVVQVFHLLGYRKRRQEAHRLVFSRRRPG